MLVIYQINRCEINFSILVCYINWGTVKNSRPTPGIWCENTRWSVNHTCTERHSVSNQKSFHLSPAPCELSMGVSWCHADISPNGSLFSRIIHFPFSVSYGTTFHNWAALQSRNESHHIKYHNSIETLCLFLLESL